MPLDVLVEPRKLIWLETWPWWVTLQQFIITEERQKNLCPRAKLVQ
jgi:hypothetical protein